MVSPFPCPFLFACAHAHCLDGPAEVPKCPFVMHSAGGFQSQGFGHGLVSLGAS